MNLQERVTELAILRADSDLVASQLAELDAAIAATELGRERVALVERLASVKAETKEVETDIRSNLALAAYRETGSKTPCEGVTIKIFKVLTYTVDAAMAWAREHAKDLIVTVESLDIKRFERVATALGAPAVEIEDPRVTIAKDLSALVYKG